MKMLDLDHITELRKNGFIDVVAYAIDNFGTFENPIAKPDDVIDGVADWTEERFKVERAKYVLNGVILEFERHGVNTVLVPTEITVNQQADNVTGNVVGVNISEL